MVFLRNASAVTVLVLFVCSSLIYTSLVHADVESVEPQSTINQTLLPNNDVLEIDLLESLAAKRQWSHLLHYRYHPYTFRTLSQNDSPDFFLSDSGRTDLVSELKADIAAFLLVEQAPDASAQCRFPARYQWIKKQLPDVDFIDQPCPEFEQWRDELDAHRITLIFPASHINSPSSMYGHTLVRLDREDRDSSKLLAYSVNFAANADPTDNELVFSYKGLTGGYPGVVSVMNYYVKTNDYQHMEYRDIWEYELSFSKSEVDQFVRHIWETKDTYFDYFFFDENCSYRLMGLLDAASERADLADEFSTKAVPVDTIRALQNNHFVRRADFRPSAAKTLESMSDQSTDAEKVAAHRLVESNEDMSLILEGLPAESQTKALELAHAYARYLSVKKKQANPVLRKRTIAILSARSKLPQGSPFNEPERPRYRDDQGHGSSRLTISGGFTDEQWHGDLGWRIAYHDILDPAMGFTPGAQIEMGDFRFRYGEDEGLQLRSLTLVDVLSLSHRTDFQRPVAWTVAAKLDRFAQQESELFSSLNIGFGRAWHTTVPDFRGGVFGDGRFFFLGEETARADNQFDEGHQVSVGPRVGWLWQGAYNQELIEFQWQPIALGDQTPRRRFSIQEALVGYGDVQLRFGFEREWASSDAVNTWNVSYAWYF